MKSCRRSAVLVCLLVIPCLLRVNAQSIQPTDVGKVINSTFQNYHVDSMNMENDNDVIDIPLFSLPQRGGMSLSFSIIMNTAKWNETYLCQSHEGNPTCSHTIVPVEESPTIPMTVEPGLGEPQIVPDQYVTWGRHQTITYSNDGGPGGVQFTTLRYFVQDHTGADHSLEYSAANSEQLRTTDGTGYLLKTPNAEPYNFDDDESGSILIDPKGIQTVITDGTAPGSGDILNTVTQTDPDGNSIQYQDDATTDSDTITDSVGRTISLTPAISTSTTGCPNLGAQYQSLSGSATWTVPGPNGGTSTYLICYTNFYAHTDFWDYQGQNETETDQNGSGTDTTNYVEAGDWGAAEAGPEGVIQSVVLPNGTYWGFIYYAADGPYSSSDPNSYGPGHDGTLAKLIFPEGGSITYTYALTTGCPDGSGEFWQAEYVSQRTVSDLNGNNYVWKYGVPLSLNPSFESLGSVVTDPNGNDTVYIFNQPSSDFGCAYLESQEKTYSGLYTSGNVVRTVNKTYQTVGEPSIIDIQPASYTYANALLTQTSTTEGSATKFANASYDSGDFSAISKSCEIYNGQNECDKTPPDVYEGLPIPMSLGVPVAQSVTDYSGATLRQTDTSYLWLTNSAYASANLLETPSTITALDGSGNQVAQTSFTYDESSYLASSGTKGHQTTKSVWNSNGSPVQTHTAWTATGMVDHTIDGNGHTSAQFAYGSQYSGLYPTSVANALGQTTSYQYDFNTGAITSVTDPNQKTTQYIYADSMGRLTEIKYPDTGDAQINYNADPTPPKITITLATGETAGPVVKKFLYDGLGRKIQTQLTSDPDGTDYVTTVYDGLDNVASVSNPYRTTSDSTYGLTKYTYDPLNRKTLQTNQDNSTENWSYNGNIVTFTNESNNSWQQTYDALGRLTNVVEPTGGSTANYTYDAFDNLLGVTQGTESRSFIYDSLSRLTSASNPETGTTTYTYDPNSNLITKKDARNISTTYSYDALNRLLSKSYSDGTLSSCYQYDGSSTDNLVGRLANEWTQTGQCSTSPPSSGLFTLRSILSYDPMGRLTGEQQCTPTKCIFHSGSQLAYSYDLAGNPSTLTNSANTATAAPVILTTCFDAAAHMSTVTGMSGFTCGTTQPTFPATLYTLGNYGPVGPLNWNLGSNLPVAQSYTKRLQVQTITATGQVPQ